MAFDFMKLKEDVLAAGRQAGDKVNEVSAQARLRFEIKAKEDFIESAYADLGRAYYERHKDDLELGENLDAFMAIKEAEEEIARLKSEIMDAQGTIVCPQCGMRQKKDHAFCSGCGTALQ